MTLPTRDQIDARYQWNAESLFASPEAWDAEFNALYAELPSLAEFKGRLSEGAPVLAAAFEKLWALTLRVHRLAVYAVMLASSDMRNARAGAMYGRVTALAGELSGQSAYLNPELITIGKDRLQGWIASEARIAMLGHYLDDLFRQQAHLRSAEVEEVLGLTQDIRLSIAEIHTRLTNADMIFPPAQDGQGVEIAVAQGSERQNEPDRALRRSAWESYTGEYLAHRHSLAATYLTSVKYDVFTMRARGFGSSLEAALHDANIPAEVFHTTLKTYRENLPVWHRYWRARRKMLGVETLQPWDLQAPLSAQRVEVTYEQSIEWITAAMAPLGPEYVEALRRGCTEERWVDVYPNQGKRQGAFSYGTYGTPPFIHMNFSGDLPALSILTHELGHSMHSWMAKQAQPQVYFDYSIFAAEVASNFNQALTRAYLFDLKRGDAAFELALLEEAFANFYRYFFVMPTLAGFEFEVHRRLEAGDSMDTEELIELLASRYDEAFGGEVAFDRERVGISWASFPHLYEMFYTFQYATGISGAHALAAPILSGEPGAAARYVDFLRAGGSDYPIEALRQAGVDLSQPGPVEATYAVLESYVARLETLAGL